MKVDKIVPIDLYHTVPTSELVLERSLKIYHIKAGQDEEILPLEAGTLVIICMAGIFSCVALQSSHKIKPGQVLLVSSTDISEMTSFSETGFEGIIIYAAEDLLINRQRLISRSITSQEMEEVMLYICLIESQIDRMPDSRAKVVESLLRALIISLQQIDRVCQKEGKIVPPFLRDFAILISRHHHSPAYFYAEKLEMTSLELSNQCKAYSGISAAEWISEYVLLEAKDLLSKTQLRPSQIAEILGFSNHDTFSRWFRRNTGNHPLDWR